jgi:cytidylate kinase
MTLSRQLGSLGHETAVLVAQRTGLRLVDRELINQAAQRAGAPEVALAMIDELNLLGLKPTPSEIQAYLAAVKVVIEELAGADNIIIVGRAGQILLANRPNALHVRITAPVPLRIDRLAQRLGISAEAARAQVNASDRYHQNYFKRYYRMPWDGPGLYDLVINTAKLTPEDSADIICAALGKCSCRGAESLPSAGEAL